MIACLYRDGTGCMGIEKVRKCIVYCFETFPGLIFGQCFYKLRVNEFVAAVATHDGKSAVCYTWVDTEEGMGSSLMPYAPLGLALIVKFLCLAEADRESWG